MNQHEAELKEKVKRLIDSAWDIDLVELIRALLLQSESNMSQKQP